MKKTIVAGMLVVSALTFAAGENSRPMNPERGRAGIEAQLAGLTEAQREELQTMREAHRKENQLLRLNMKETDLKMERELLKEKPNRVAINKLIDERSEYRVAMEKNRMDFKLDAKEKFGIEGKQHHNKNKKHRVSKGQHMNK